MNDCYPEKEENNLKVLKAKAISYEDFVHRIEQRGFDAFWVEGGQIKVDTTDFSKINMEKLFSEIVEWKRNITWI